jgi:tetratricopeptide (TPR) repeat protein
MKYTFLLMIAAGLGVVSGGCHPDNGMESVSTDVDQSLRSYQAELLDIAFATASAIPLEPHIKDRARAQEGVVQACLELHQPLRARQYIEQIPNWRRGLGYADLALYYVQQGADEDIGAYLDKAAEIAEETEDWRRDRIRVRIAQTHTWLGQKQQAEEFGADVEEAETGKVARAEAMVCDDDSFDEMVDTLDGMIATGTFDIVKNSLEAYTQLFGRFYGNIDRRTVIEEKIKASWGHMPISIQMDLLMCCAHFSLANADKGKAVTLLNEARAMMDAAKWHLRFEIPLRAELAVLRFRTGQTDQARTEVQGMLTLYDTDKDKIVNIYRARTLCPIAEAYQAMGDTTQALEVYKRVLEAGVENPNSRPRAEDLVATCCSLAEHTVEPGVDVMNRIREIYNDLGDPW